jgi:hypothetical protein
MTNLNHRNNHFNLEIRITSLTSLHRLTDILRERHGHSNDAFGFIKDRLTIVIESSFKQDNLSSEFSLKELKELQNSSSRLEINFEI